MNRKQRRAAAKTAPQERTTPPAFARALEHHRAGRLAEAEAGYFAVLAEYPSHFPSMFHLGLISLGRGDALVAAERFGQAVTMDPDHVDARVALTVALRLGGRSEEAIAAGRSVLALKPDKVEIYNEIAIAQRELGRMEESAEACRAAIALKPEYADAHNNLGNVLADSGRWAEAVDSYQAALRFNPGLVEAYNNLGGAFSALERHEEAAAVCKKALELRPEYPEALNNLGNALAGLKRYEPAAAAFRLGLTIRPGYVEAHNNLALAQQNLGHLEEAEAECRAALAIRPDYPQAHNNLGHILKDLGRLEEAEAECRAALALKPQYPEALSNLGNALTDLCRYEEAIACYHAALEHRPNYPEAYSNLGHTLKSLGRVPDSIDAYHKAIALRPDYAQAHNNLAFSLMLCGDYVEGWREYEWRWKIGGNGLVKRSFAQPQWEGEPLDGRTLLLYPEQGLGDMLQFCRFAPLAAAMGGRVVLEVYRPLVRLMEGLTGVAQVVAAGTQLPPFDCHLPLLSMPRVLGTTIDTVPAGVPYLFADPDDAAEWGRKLASLPGLKVGLVWAGDPHPGDLRAYLIDRRRSIDPARLRPVFEVSGVSLISLQMGVGARRIEALPETLRPVEIMDGVRDFADTAAIVANLDLVITVDTSVAHLAGALGKPTWLLSRYDGCWRWLLERDDSPWYPTLRVFRQPAPDAWEPVVERVALELAALAD